MTCKAEGDVEEIGMVRGRATHSPHEHPTKTRNRKSSRFITRHSLPSHAHVSLLSKIGGDQTYVLEHSRSIWTDADVNSNSPAAAIEDQPANLALLFFSYTSWVMNPCLPWTAVTLHLNVFMHQRSEPCGVVGAFHADHSYSQRGKRLPKGRISHCIKVGGRLLRST
jgi:hypothetical protein